MEAALENVQYNDACEDDPQRVKLSKRDLGPDLNELPARRRRPTSL